MVWLDGVDQCLYSISTRAGRITNSLIKLYKPIQSPITHANLNFPPADLLSDQTAFHLKMSGGLPIFVRSFL